MENDIDYAEAICYNISVVNAKNRNLKQTFLIYLQKEWNYEKET